MTYDDTHRDAQKFTDGILSRYVEVHTWSGCRLAAEVHPPGQRPIASDPAYDRSVTVGAAPYF